MFYIQEDAHIFFFILSVCAFVFLDSAKWAYGWIDDPNSVVNGIENTLNRYVTNW